MIIPFHLYINLTLKTTVNCYTISNIYKQTDADTILTNNKSTLDNYVCEQREEEYHHY